MPENRVQQYTSDLPGMEGASFAEISRATGISASMLSRMFSNVPEQKRVNPSLETLEKLRDYLTKKSGTYVSLDQVVSAIS